jgi:hypothetical protein
MRQATVNGRWLSTGDPRRRLSTGRTRTVLLAVVGLILAVLSPLVVEESPTSAATAVWGTPTQIPVPSSVGGGTFTSVSCSDALDCTAVGWTNGDLSLNGFGPQPIAVNETNGVWGNVSLVPVSGLLEAQWYSVSCTSALNCVAVGELGERGTNGAGAFEAVYATETNIGGVGEWGPVNQFPGSGLEGSANQMNSVSCPAVGYCVAVGYIGSVEPPTPSLATAAVETAGVWGPDNLIAAPTSTTSMALVDVGCVAVNLCYAVGTDSSNQPYSVLDTSGTWGAPQLINGASSVNAISCTASSVCTAVGNGSYSTESGGGWNTFSLPGINMSSVSCVDATDCTAIGSGSYVTETGGVWGAPTPISGFPVGTTSIAGVSCTTLTNCTAVGYDGGTASTVSQPFYVTASPPPVVTSPGTASHGYWLVGSDGGIFSFGSAPFYGSTGSLVLQRSVVGITPAANDAGYWLVASDGGIFTFGNAQYYGSIPGLGLSPAGSGLPHSLNAPIVGLVPTSDGGGYFMVGSDGGVFTFGDATFEGSCPGIGGCSGAGVAVIPDATGNGYWLVTATGHVYTFGDAPYYGAPGPQGSPVTSAVRTTDGGGYWILLANGTVYANGDAANLGGPVASVDGADSATTIFTTSDGGGYWVASANGSVFTYGDAPYEGGMSGVRLNGSIIAATGW